MGQLGQRGERLKKYEESGRDERISLSSGYNAPTFCRNLQNRFLALEGACALQNVLPTMFHDQASRIIT